MTSGIDKNFTALGILNITFKIFQLPEISLVNFRAIKTILNGPL